jgi:predicted nucleotide-binding protein
MLSNVFKDSAEMQLADILAYPEKDYLAALARACEGNLLGDGGEGRALRGAQDIEAAARYEVERRAALILQVCVALMASLPGESPADILALARSQFLNEFQKIRAAGIKARKKLPAYIFTKFTLLTFEMNESMNANLSRLASGIESATSQFAIEASPVLPQSRQAEEVFLVHGHNHGVLEQVARFLEQLNLSVHILHEKPNEGNTLIEKFEQYAGRAAFALVLLTPDDRGGPARLDPAEYRARPRQNVIFELGYFFALLGRKKVCAIHMPEIELPSDYQGIAYVPFEV